MRLLIVEDDKELASFVSRAMQEDSHAVDTACDGVAGEEMALSEDYDLVILDLMLPRKSGLDVLRTLRLEGLQVPVLLLTARNSVSSRVDGLDTGADDYLGKPFALAELRARVRALLRRGGQEKSPLLQVANLTMNPAAHEVRIGDTLVELTNREFGILEYLLRNKGRLVSKGMIAEHVWDYHFDSDYNLIEVYIRRLRQKLETAAPTQLIRTVRNGGYILKEPDA